MARRPLTPEPFRGTDLTRFQLEMLAFLYGQPRHGAGLQRELEAFHDEDLNHRRVYENLDKLATRGLVEKHEYAVSGKAHEYEITDEGEITVYEWASELAVELNII